MKNLIIGAGILGAVGYCGPSRLSHHKIKSAVVTGVMGNSDIVPALLDLAAGAFQFEQEPAVRYLPGTIRFEPG